MNKSLEYIKNRIKTGYVNNMTEEEFSNMQVVKFTDVCAKFNHHNILENKETGEVYIDMKYDPDAKFDYFTLETCYCDGTFMFMGELIDKIINKICSLQTYYSPAIEEEIDLSKYHVHYIVGDFVANTYYIESPDLEKPWMKDKFTVMLPIKFEVEEVK